MELNLEIQMYGKRKMIMKNKKALIRYAGAKWRLADWIISYFQEHKSYLEPFFGSGAVLFSKERSNIETVNDLDGDVVNFFSCIQKDPEKLAHILYYTPYSRQVYDEAYTKIPGDDFEMAANFAIKCNMGYGYRSSGVKVGWKNDVQGRDKAYAANDWVQLPERLLQAAERLRGVQIENVSAVKLIRRFNFSNVLIYCDPPYLLQTRTGGKQYKKEMSVEEHIQLLEALSQHSGPAIISGYDNEVYNTLLKGWHTEKHKSLTQGLSNKQEVLWMNFGSLENQQLNIWS